MADPYYPFYPGDYQRDTRGLTLIENGAYRVLLDEYYMSGPISSDLDRIYRIAGAINEDEKQAVNFVIKKYFVNENGVFRNKRADNEREKRGKFLKSQAEKSALGVKARRSTQGLTRGSTRRLTPPSPSPSPSPSPTPEKDTFDQFWDSYPVKVGKKKCRDIWNNKKKMNGHPPIDQIILAIEQQKKSERWIDGYIPNPETWLNQGRWEDQLPEPLPYSRKTAKNIETLKNWRPPS